jgi:hypothetical protein
VGVIVGISVAVDVPVGLGVGEGVSVSVGTSVKVEEGVNVGVLVADGGMDVAVGTSVVGSIMVITFWVGVVLMHEVKATISNDINRNPAFRFTLGSIIYSLTMFMKSRINK